MDLIELVQKYHEGATPAQMTAVVYAINKFLIVNSSEEQRRTLYKDIYGIVSEGHFDEHFAKDAISKMYYEDEYATKHYAPFFTEDDIKNVFEQNKDEIPDYTIHDLAVTMNMLRSDNNRFYERYAKDDTDRDEMVVCMAIEYLQDPDAPYPTQKIWKYING